MTGQAPTHERRDNMVCQHGSRLLSTGETKRLKDEWADARNGMVEGRWHRGRCPSPWMAETFVRP